MKIDFAKTKEQIKSEIVFSMCLTKRHDYGLEKTGVLTGGMTEKERSFLNQKWVSYTNIILDH